jgi:hypothetical protein
LEDLGAEYAKTLPFGAHGVSAGEQRGQLQRVTIMSEVPAHSRIAQALTDCIQGLTDAGLHETANLVRVAEFDFLTRVHGVTDTELDALIGLMRRKSGAPSRREIKSANWPSNRMKGVRYARAPRLRKSERIFSAYRSRPLAEP